MPVKNDLLIIKNAKCVCDALDAEYNVFLLFEFINFNLPILRNKTASIQETLLFYVRR